MVVESDVEVSHAGPLVSFYILSLISWVTNAKFLDTINKSKTQDCKRNFLYMVSKSNQLVYS